MKAILNLYHFSELTYREETSVSEFNLEEFLDNHPKLKRFDGGLYAEKGTLVRVTNGIASITYTMDIGRATYKYRGCPMWFTSEDLVKEIRSTIPNKYIRRSNSSTDFYSKEGQFIQALHRSGYYYLLCTSENIKTDAIKQKLINIRTNSKIKTVFGENKLNYKDFVFEKVGVYKNNEERVRRKALIIKMLGESNCLNMQ